MNRIIVHMIILITYIYIYVMSNLFYFYNGKFLGIQIKQLPTGSKYLRNKILCSG